MQGMSCCELGKNTIFNEHTVVICKGRFAFKTQSKIHFFVSGEREQARWVQGRHRGQDRHRHQGQDRGHE